MGAYYASKYFKGARQIKSFLLVYRAVKTTINDQGVVWIYGKCHKGVNFCVGRCALTEWVVGGGGLDGYFGEQGLGGDYLL